MVFRTGSWQSGFFSALSLTHGMTLISLLYSTTWRSPGESPVPQKGSCLCHQRHCLCKLGTPSSCTGSLQPGKTRSRLQRLLELCWGTGPQGYLCMVLSLGLGSPWGCNSTALASLTSPPRPGKASVYLETIKIEHLDTRLGGSKQVKCKVNKFKIFQSWLQFCNQRPIF